MRLAERKKVLLKSAPYVPIITSRPASTRNNSATKERRGKKSSLLASYFFSRGLIRSPGCAINLRGYTRAGSDSSQVSLGINPRKVHELRGRNASYDIAQNYRENYVLISRCNFEINSHAHNFVGRLQGVTCIQTLIFYAYTTHASIINNYIPGAWDRMV